MAPTVLVTVWLPVDLIPPADCDAVPEDVRMTDCIDPAEREAPRDSEERPPRDSLDLPPDTFIEDVFITDWLADCMAPAVRDPPRASEDRPLPAVINTVFIDVCPLDCIPPAFMETCLREA